MDQGLNAFGRDRVLKAFADWTDRINNGEVPPQAPARPCYNTCLAAACVDHTDLKILVLSFLITSLYAANREFPRSFRRSRLIKS
jgi:hypothetical protein